MEINANRFMVAARMGFYVLAALLPFGFIPGIQNIDFGREIIFSVLTLLIFVLWLISILTSGEITYRHSVILYATLILVVVLGVATFFSKSPLGSLISADPGAEKFSTLILGVILMVLAGGVFVAKEKVALFFLVLIFAGGLSALLQAVQMLTGFVPYKYVIPLAQGIDFNLIGTANGLSLFYAALFLLTLGFISSFPLLSLKLPLRYALFGSAMFLALDLLLINFRTSWIVCLGAGIFFLGILFKDKKRTIKFGNEETVSSASRPKGLDWRTIMVLVFLSLSVLMVMVRSPLVSRVVLPAELSPNLRETINIASGVFKEGPKETLFGSGPATFGFDWGYYKNPQLNLPQIIGGTRVDLWGVRFNQGFSLVSTAVVTTGVFGIIALLLFFAAFLIVFLRRMLGLRFDETPFALGAFLAMFAVMLADFVYPANFSLTILFFLMAGILSVVLSSASDAGDETIFPSGAWQRVRGRLGLSRSFLGLEERRIAFENPWSVFLSSLTAVFLLAASIGAIYIETNRVRAAYAFQKGAQAISEGKVGDSINLFQSAAASEEYNFRHYQALTQSRIEAVRQLIGRAAGGENVQQEFFSAVEAARLSAQRAIQLNPNESFVWRTQGSLYELIIPYVAGAEQLAFSSYQRATQLDPLNPAAWVEMGRSALTFADKVQLGFNQIPAKDQPQYATARTLALQEAEKAFSQATQVKPDFAPAHFLLAQTALRLGNIAGAIQSTQNAQIAAPFDIGIAFQLGLLFYQTNDIDKAQVEFERAVSLSPTYSNARYFLGLIYDRKGNRDGAIQQFEEIAKLNPDNAEVKKILQNLKSGKPALDGIVPPAAPPEKRKETPVREREGAAARPPR